MADNNVNWKLAVVWIIATVVLYLLVLVLSILYLGITTYLLYMCLKVLPKIMFLAIVGYTITNFAAVIKLSGEERKKHVKITKDKVIILISVIVMNIDFMLASIIGNWIYTATSIGLLIPLIWFSMESWLIDKGLWYLTPAGLITRIIIIPFKTRAKVTPTYFLAGEVGILSLTGKVQRRLA